MDPGTPVLYRGNCLFGQRRHRHEPLFGKRRLDNGAAPVAVPDPMLVDLHLFQQSLLVKIGDHLFAACKPFQAGIGTGRLVHDAVFVHDRDAVQPVATADFEIVIDLEPTRTEAYTNLARALSQQGRLDEAASVLRGARDLFPHQIDITLALAWVLATAPDEQLRDGKAAMKLLNPLLQKRRAPRLLDAYAAAQAATGDYAAAIRTADEAIATLRRAGPGAAATLAEVKSHRALYAQKQPLVTIPEATTSRP